MSDYKIILIFNYNKLMKTGGGQAFVNKILKKKW